MQATETDAVRSLRVLVTGFTSDAIQQIRLEAAAMVDFDVRVFSRRRTDLRPTDTAGRYDAILLDVGAFTGDVPALEAALEPLVRDTPVVLTGSLGDPRYQQALIHAGCEEVLTTDQTHPAALIAAAVKATARRQRAESFEAQRAALHSIEHTLGQAPVDEEPIVIIDQNAAVAFSNQAARDLGNDTIARLVEQVARQPCEGPAVLITPLELPAGSSTHEYTLTATRLPVHERAYTIVRIKTQRQRRLLETLEQRLSLIDGSTGLPGRAAFLQRLDELIAEAADRDRRVGLLLLQVDQMWSVNEALGHQTGQALLGLVAQRLRYGLRSDDWLGYLGGNSYAIVSGDHRENADLGALADKLRREIGAAVELNGERIQVTASLGIAVYPQDGANITELLQHADLALERSRARGGDAYEFFDQALGLELRRRWELQMALHRALEQQELWIAFQPVMTADLEVCGAEALLRWRHPQLGAMSPADFVPVLEQCGLIHTVGQWVLHRSCEQAQRWRQAGFAEFRVSVNLSPVQLRDPDLPDKVYAALTDSGLPPACLALEITENVLLDRTEDTLRSLSALSALGIGLHIDDFGTGFSSIAYLKRLPFTGIKIDRSFVHDVANDGRGQALIRWIVQLAHAFGLDTVAEGVETASDAQAMRDMGVNRLQGFHFSPGIPSDEFERRYL